MRLELYIAGVSQANLLDWRTRLSEDAQAVGIKVAHFPIQETPETLRERLPVVLDELRSIPEQWIEFHAADAERLCTFAYTNYRSRIDRDWNVSLYFPSNAAIFLPFAEKLLSRRVAHLYYQEGTSDKVYHLYLTQSLTDDCYAVISRYGRRDKLQKGYQVGHPTPPQQLKLIMKYSEFFHTIQGEGKGV